MTIYLTIITTALVLTQIIRITQNAINLKRQNKEIKRNIDWIERNEVTEEDFETQKEAYRLIVKRLGDKDE